MVGFCVGVGVMIYTGYTQSGMRAVTRGNEWNE